MLQRKLLFGPFFLAIVLGFIHIVNCSPTSDTEQSAGNQGQHCGDHKWIVEHNPCPDKSRHPRFDGEHWTCCDHLTEEDKERNARERERKQKQHAKNTQNGRCKGKRIPQLGKVPKCDYGEFNTPKVDAHGVWDCCKSLTPEEEKRTQKRKEAIEGLCPNDYFQEWGFIVNVVSCEPGRYAKKDDTNTLVCCQERTQEEKKIGDQQREDAAKDAGEYREYLNKTKEQNAVNDPYRSCDQDARFCTSVTPTTHKS